MDPSTFNLHAAMREHREEVLEDIDALIEQATAAYDRAVRNARQAFKITNSPTCVVCRRCGAKVGESCVTNAGKKTTGQKATTPHSARSYDYGELVKKVHRNDIVIATKSRRDQLVGLTKGTDYSLGHHTTSIEVMPGGSVTVSAIEVAHRVLYRPVYMTNVVGITPSTAFSHSELLFMMNTGIDVHIVGNVLIDALTRASPVRAEE